MDVIKTRVQYRLNTSWIEIFKELIQKEGFVGFFRGGLWRGLKSVYNFLTKTI
jgi:hypothetical protein